MQRIDSKTLPQNIWNHGHVACYTWNTMLTHSFFRILFRLMLDDKIPISTIFTTGIILGRMHATDLPREEIRNIVFCCNCFNKVFSMKPKMSNTIVQNSFIVQQRNNGNIKNTIGCPFSHNPLKHRCSIVCLQNKYHIQNRSKGVRSCCQSKVPHMVTVENGVWMQVWRCLYQRSRTQDRVRSLGDER